MEAVMDYIYICIVRIGCNELLEFFKITWGDFGRLYVND